MPKINPLVGGKKIIVIVGPTASGKSNLGIFLARKFNGEIISADSRQVYRGMDIGTGKVTKKEQRLARHYLLDVASPKKIFTVSDFKKLGEKTIKDILNKNKIPFIVGGTGFYIDVLLGRTPIAEVPPDKNLRLKLEKSTKENLFARLKKLDPERAKTIDFQNKRRLIRALEIIIATGKKVPKLPMSTHCDHGGLTQPDDRKQYKTLFLGINLEKDILSKKIKTRLNKRLEQGMVQEVQSLLNSKVSRKRLYDLGLEYRWISEYLSGKINYAEMKTGLNKAVVKYSKRQMTWFKKNKKIHWVKNKREAETLSKKFISPQILNR